MSPPVAAEASRRASITRTCPGGQASIASRCGWPRPFEGAEQVDVLARRDVTQRIGLAHHARGRPIQEKHALDEDVAQAALEKHGGQRGSGNALERFAARGG
jgi:hypothetical protein